MSRFFVLVCVLFLAGCGVTGFLSNSEPSAQLKSTALLPGLQTLLGGQPKLPTQALTIGKAKLTVEVADTEATLTLGLSGRASLALGEGMLFQFAEPGRYEFWMKDMLFPLDFIWIAKNQVVQVDLDIPAPAKAGLPARVKPQQPVDTVIEVPAGWAFINQIVIGAQVTRLIVEPTIPARR